MAQATRRRDLGSKLEDYLRDGLRELWIIDQVEQCALIYRRGELVARHARGTGARLVAERVPEVSVDLDEVFRAARRTTGAGWLSPVFCRNPDPGGDAVADKVVHISMRRVRRLTESSSEYRAV